jgi:DNA-binding response OmpR family regulator
MRQTLARHLHDAVLLMVPEIDHLRSIILGLSDGQLTLAAPEPGGPVGDLLIDLDGYRASWRGVPLRLTPAELRLLSSLATQPLTLWTHERLYVTVWGGSYLGDASVVHAAVKRLRQRLREVDQRITIETVRGVGYRLVMA